MSELSKKEAILKAEKEGKIAKQKEVKVILTKKYKILKKDQPLSKNIREELIKENPEITKTQIRSFLKRKTNRIEYLKNIIEGEPRFNLKGQKDGICSKEEERYSVQRKRSYISKLGKKRRDSKKNQEPKLSEKTKPVLTIKTRKIFEKPKIEKVENKKFSFL